MLWLSYENSNSSSMYCFSAAYSLSCLDSNIQDSLAYWWHFLHFAFYKADQKWKLPLYFILCWKMIAISTW